MFVYKTFHRNREKWATLPNITQLEILLHYSVERFESGTKHKLGIIEIRPNLSGDYLSARYVSCERYR